ncbi:uveal autoantigen with coiled-coil domains and ankyrin repeat [Forsythia ovata]|uniref:Uveal autoantigen with coiled-coil domains and ankyrin repeat n=1 Tax=Forsythia ovata TaxID=205694 RepID=A0ABD1VEW6_9LAMI
MPWFSNLALLIEINRFFLGCVDIAESNKTLSELAKLQKLHEEKMSRIQELKKQKEGLKIQFEKQKKEDPENTKPFDILCDKYNNLKDDYNALLTQRSEKKEM